MVLAELDVASPRKLISQKLMWAFRQTYNQKSWPYLTGAVPSALKVPMTYLAMLRHRSGASY